MRHYAGFDVSLKETFICIVNENEEVVHRSEVASDPNAIAKQLKKTGLKIEKGAIESGSLSHWLVSELQKMKLPIICIDARHLSSVLSMKINKTDTNDAFGIANALRAGFVREVPLKSQELVDTGVLLQSRSILVQERTKLKNAIRGLLKTYGIKTPTKGHFIFGDSIRELIVNQLETTKLAINSLLEAFEKINEEISKLEKEIQKLGENSEDAMLLMTIPGVGLLTALSFLVSLGDYSRFKNSRDVAAYLGLTPRQYSSGEKECLGRISKCGSRQTRSLLVEAATVMLTRTKTWSKPKAWALKLHRKKGFKKATVALGRKLAVIMHAMLTKQEKFKPGENPEKKKKSKKLEKKLKRAA